MRQAFSLVTAFAFLAACAVSTNADEPDTKPIKIPLKDIWAWEMPGTRNVLELEPPVSGPEASGVPLEERQRRNRDSRVQQILRSLRPIREPGAKIPDAGPGFAVLGAGQEALRHAHRVFVEHKEPRRSYTVDDEITAVFFSYSFSSYVYIQEVERRGKDIEIRYRFVPHLTDNLTNHFALIPLGQLPVGDYQVEMIQLPMDEFPQVVGKLVDKGWVQQKICKSFSFSVEERVERRTTVASTCGLSAKYPGGALQSKLATQ